MFPCQKQIVQEFRQAVGEKSVSDLRHALKLDDRCGSGSTVQEQQAAVALIALLTTNYPQFADWKELVKPEGHANVQRYMREHADFVKAERMPEVGGVILAPQGIQPRQVVVPLLMMPPFYERHSTHLCSWFSCSPLF